MKRFVCILAFSVLLFLAGGCVRDPFSRMDLLPDGTPVTVTLGFGAPEIPVLEVGTRAEATPVDEAHVHDLYVFIFRPGDVDPSKYIKLYGRYFSYEHQVTKSDLDLAANECWFVENQTITGVTPSYAQTKGAVKIATSSYSGCIIVLMANVSNTLTQLDGDDPVIRLNQIDSLEQLQRVQVKLTQDVVSRKDYFLMTAVAEGVTTSEMRWNIPSTSNYDPDHNLALQRVDAKVQFRIKANTTNISKVTPRYWQVCKAPKSCYLFSSEQGGPNSLNVSEAEAFESFEYFDTEETYFDTTETDPDTGQEIHVFTFYTLENKLIPIRSATAYKNREEQVKESDPDHPGYVKNGKWKYANENSTYVRFDVILTLELAAIEAIDPTAHEAMTTDVAFVVHLGDFVNSDRSGSGASSNFNDYNTLRGYCYTYNVTINNSTSIHTEVTTGIEVDPAQEGFLLLVKEGVVNCDAHYEYRSITFNYNDKLDPAKFSWYVKTPFNEGGALTAEVSAEDGIYYYPAPDSIMDYKWVLFQLDSVDAATGKYLEDRRAFPGEGAYHPAWKLVPGTALADSIASCPKLLDISQLISYIFFNQKRKKDGLDNVFDTDNKVIATAFVNEYYYETNPETGDVDDQLWRKFVNAKPREMHILSDAETSLDRKSDVISSSQSIIQQSIQTIYNIYEPELESIWGTEHKDEMREMAGEAGWPFGSFIGKGTDPENGRENSAKLWGANNATPDWADYVNYKVPNNMPELLEAKRGLAYSCMTRNRDNNGNGRIDPEEIRWYLAAESQLIAMFVGAEALSQTARLYQPFPGQWRAHVVSSTMRGDYPRVLTAEEGVATHTASEDWMLPANLNNASAEEKEAYKSAMRSVRCVRNIGTYDSGSGRRDISYAPLTKKADQYYTAETTGTGTDAYYTFQFNRLDPKALRPYTSEELPFHNEHSAHNRVYLRMITQSAAQHIHIDKDTLLYKINPEISAAGVNPYCPAGYRIPNQVELALMSAAIPDKINMLPENHPDYPSQKCRTICRTYYSRAYFGKPEDKKDSEAKKASWVWGASKLNCSDTSGNYLVTRCVKDNDLTGTIMGDMNVPLDSICPGEKMTLDFKFSSSASSFYYASLKLRYTLNGVNKEKEILLDKEASGVQFVHSQEVTVPTLEGLGVAALPDTGLLITFRFEIRNSGGRSMVVEKETRLVSSHLTGSIQLLPGWKDGAGFPVKIDAVSFSRRYPINSIMVKEKVGTGAWTSRELIGVEHPRVYRDTVYIYPTITPAAPPATEGDSVTVQVVMGCVDGNSYTWQGSIKILRAGYTPNGTSDKWTDTATGIDFSRGDFIEARIQPTSDASKAKRGLLSIGNNINDWNAGAGKACIHTYFPGATASQFKLRLAARYGASSGSSSSDIGSDHSGSPIILRFSSRDSLMIDNARYTGWRAASYDEFWTTMFSQTTMYIGQQEGSNRSNSTYDYIRVVHQAEEKTP